MKSFLWIVLSILVATGCALNLSQQVQDKAQSLSEGAQLMVDTHILTLDEITRFIPNNSSIEGNQLSWEKLNHWNKGISIDSALEWHPVLYPYFFVTQCQSAGCVQEKFIDMAQGFTQAYMQDARVVAQKHPFRPLKIVRSDWDVNQAMVEAIDQEPHNIKKKVGVYLRLRNFDEVNSAQNLWGNHDPREQPDGFSSKVLDDVERAKLLIKVSQSYPDVLTFIGISQTRLKEGQSCFGGFFVKAGKVTHVPELGCNGVVL